MLKNIPSIITPELIKILMEMGHGDEIVFADGNFPSASHAQRLVRMDGHTVTELLEAIMPFFPLDTYADAYAILMEVVKGDPVEPVIWDTYQEVLERHDKEGCVIQNIDRFDFYDRAKKAYAVVATSEGALYANLILKKGVVK